MCLIDKRVYVVFVTSLNLTNKIAQERKIANKILGLHEKAGEDLKKDTLTYESDRKKHPKLKMSQNYQTGPLAEK